jgi:hypothetical protein
LLTALHELVEGPLERPEDGVVQGAGLLGRLLPLSPVVPCPVDVEVEARTSGNPRSAG